MPRFLTLLAVLAIASIGASAQDVDPSQLENLKNRAEAEKSRQDEIKTQQQGVKKDIKVLSGEVRQLSSRLSVLESNQAQIVQNLGELQSQETEMTSQISDRRKSVTELLAALQRIENNPPPALATNPGDAAKASRAGLLIKGLTSQIRDRVDVLNSQLENLNALQEEIGQKQVELTKNQAALKARKRDIEGKVERKNALERSLNSDYAAAQKRRLALASQAEDLQDLINQLERKSRDIVPRIKPDPNAVDAEPDPVQSSGSLASKPITFPKGALRFSKSKRNLHPPVIGTLQKRYSSAHPGMTISAAKGTQVWAPAAGRVEFAGPFKNFDQVAILNVGDGYYVLLTGLGRLLVQSDSEVSAGDPIGLMPVNSSSNEKLYIEVRKNGSTTDPVPWFGTRFAKPDNG